MDTEEPTPNYLEVQECLDAVKRYCDTNGISREGREMADKLHQEGQNYRLSLPTRNPKTFSYEIIIELSLVQRYYSILLSYYCTGSS